MKITDIQIGDWYHYMNNLGKDGIYEKDIQVKNIYGCDVNCQVRGYEVISGTPIRNLHPIPLTAEILEKNGFVDVGSEVYECDVLPFYIWWEYDRNRLGIDIEDSTYDEENFAQMLRVPVSYVHELQHCLRIVGIDKEITI